MTGAEQGRILPAVAGAVGGLLLLSTLALRWATRGPGATMVGHRLAQALRAVPGRASGWAELGGIVLYVVALVGAAVLATCWVRHPLVVVARGAVGLLVVGALGGLAGRGVLPLDRWAAGPAVALVGGLLLLAPAVAAVGRSRQRSVKGLVPR
jgi:hypothetical protein